MQHAKIWTILSAVVAGLVVATLSLGILGLRPVQAQEATQDEVLLVVPGQKVDRIVDGAGIDSLIAARMVGPGGRVVGVDMTPAMLAKARRAGQEAGLDNVEFREGFGEALPVFDSWADVVISNGVLNLMPDKAIALAEMARVLKPAGRLQIADILVEKAVPEGAKRNIVLWTG